MPDVFDRAKVRIVIQEPFYACLLLGMEIVEGSVLPNGQELWMAATDGTRMYINRENLNELTLAKCVGVIKHELMHAAMLHPFRIGTRSAKKWNHANDYVINDMIFHEGGDLPDGVLHDPNNWNRHKSSEEVYALMPDGPGGGQGGRGGQKGNNPLDDDLIPAPDQSPEAVQEAVGRVVQAAQVAKAIGKLPAYMESVLGDLLDPKVAWEQELAEFLTEVSQSDYTFARPNRRFVYEDLYLPSAYSQDAMGRLAVVFDTSGSVSMQEIERFASETVGAIEGTLPLALDIVYCDAKVQHVDSFDHPTVEDVAASLKRHGSGGTNMVVALDWIEENIDDVKAAIVFTDGYTPFGHERDFPVLWAITEHSIVADMGRTVHVDLN